ncbi:MAG: 1-deoxy-D-xylulose-5-phosphate synthase [Clostridiales bacterium]|nr:1-deoxy-D-xylulose-5-phosphate synthase [Clostridiales bacterium]
MDKIKIDYDNIYKNIKQFGDEELNVLRYDIRNILMDTISKNGGHLASNLGVVELTIALHRCFNFEVDKVIFDVGHQSYTHKLLTNRKEQFSTIREFNGLSGYPKITESKYDFFNTGHSSTSISAALGYARAAKVNKENIYSIAVIGDGALTGGMAFEALNDAGISDEKIIVILNDNEMSITKNVGGFSRHLANIRSKKIYFTTNDRVKRIAESIPFIGKVIYKMIHRMKTSMKYLLTQGVFFEELGFNYIGPVDGHDISKVSRMLEDAKKINGPVLLHVVTKKGKGYKKAQELPQFYHGVSQFDLEEGIVLNNKTTSSKVVGDYLVTLAKDDEKIQVICPATTVGNGLYTFYNTYKDRYFDVGIAEQHAVTLAAGMALGKSKPIVVMYATFLQRAYDQMLHDICLMKLPVLFLIDRAGIVGADGETHQGIYDVALLSHMPYVEILAPSREVDIQKMIDYGLEQRSHPVVIRYAKGECLNYDIKEELEPLGSCYIQKGTDVVLLSYNKTLTQLISAAKQLVGKGISCSIIDIRRLKPLNIEIIKKVIDQHQFTLFVEECVTDGTMYHHFINKPNVHGLNLDGKPCPQGNYLQVLRHCKLDELSIVSYVLEHYQKKD